MSLQCSSLRPSCLHTCLHFCPSRARHEWLGLVPPLYPRKDFALNPPDAVSEDKFRCLVNMLIPYTAVLCIFADPTGISIRGSGLGRNLVQVILSLEPGLWKAFSNCGVKRALCEGLKSRLMGIWRACRKRVVNLGTRVSYVCAIFLVSVYIVWMIKIRVTSWFNLDLWVRTLVSPNGSTNHFQIPTSSKCVVVPKQSRNRCGLDPWPRVIGPYVLPQKYWVLSMWLAQIVVHFLRDVGLTFHH